jgi:NAD(P)-dependent dehydrogenase (short-subunit alcohol dehydrogenase family)
MQTLLITGATDSIGRETARQLPASAIGSCCTGARGNARNRPLKRLTGGAGDHVAVPVWGDLAEATWQASVAALQPFLTL